MTLKTAIVKTVATFKTAAVARESTSYIFSQLMNKHALIGTAVATTSFEMQEKYINRFSCRKRHP